MTDTPSAETPAADPARPGSRIQRENRARILEAALEVFAAQGFAGGTVDRIAEHAQLSKPNVLYYFASKEAIHAELLTSLLDLWMAPLAAIDPQGEPLDEVLAYVRRKLDLSRERPRESRLFASEVFAGAPRLGAILQGALKRLVDEKAAVIGGWMAEGRLAPLDPHHLMFAIWALTQHYADFDVQVRMVLGEGVDPFDRAAPFVETAVRRMLTPA